MVAYGWQTVANVWALAIAVMAVVFWLATKDDPQLEARRAQRRQARAAAAPCSSRCKNIQVWRFSLYYFFVFGAFVALALWLPRYLIGVYGLDITTAGMIGAAYSVPASLFRVYGGVLSDRYGARRVMYWTFGVSVAGLLHPVLSADRIRRAGHPRADRASASRPASFAFTVIVFVLGFFMSLGKAAVYKHIPVYYPNHVGAVGGVVGLVGGLGGFVLPILFGVLNDLTGVWQSCFMAAVRRRRRSRSSGCISPSAPWRRASTARSSRSCPSCPRCRRSTSPSTSACSGRISSRTGGRRTRSSGTPRAARSPGATC